MPAEIRINDVDDGNWIMQNALGLYNPHADHCIAVHRDGYIRGGVVFSGYLGSALGVHMAGDGSNWATRDFLWMVYDYSFNQLGVKKLYGIVAADNIRALAIDLRMGFHVAARIPDILPDGGDLIVVVCNRADAKWLKVRPRSVISLVGAA